MDEALWDRPGYVDQRAEDLGGRAVPGLRHAWNQLKHDARSLDDLVLVRRTEGRAYPRVHPWSYQEIRWLSQLPEGDRRRRPPNRWEEEEKGSYADYLADNPVRHLAPDITRFLLAQAEEEG